MSCYGAKIGDRVIGNELANQYHVYTKEGWIGVIVKIDSCGQLYARGKNIFGTSETYGISADCFDFYDEYTAEILERELGFRKETLYDYN